MSFKKYLPQTRILVFLAFLALAAGHYGCQGTDTVWLCDIVPQTQPSPAPSTGGVEHTGQVAQPLNANLDRLWQIPAIPVCWESGAWAGTTAADREIVRRAVQESWETALAVPEVAQERWIHFTGWNSCDDNDDAEDNGLRITVEDKNPRTSALGTALAGKKDGVLFDFTFINWSPVCSGSEASRQFCIYAIAVHEFGHALGLAHEQNRLDTPDTCTTPAQGENGNFYIGEWDSQSVMNYCNPNWNNAGVLSDKDQAGIRTIYYPDTAKLACQQLRQ